MKRLPSLFNAKTVKRKNVTVQILRSIIVICTVEQWKEIIKCLEAIIIVHSDRFNTEINVLKAHIDDKKKKMPTGHFFNLLSDFQYDRVAMTAFHGMRQLIRKYIGVDEADKEVHIEVHVKSLFYLHEAIIDSQNEDLRRLASQIRINLFHAVLMDSEEYQEAIK